MKLCFKQRPFSWSGKYNVFDEDGQTLFTVEGRPNWGHILRVSDKKGLPVGEIQEVIFEWTPRYELFERDRYLGNVQPSLKKRSFKLFKPSYSFSGMNWKCEGDFAAWDYAMFDMGGKLIAQTGKEDLHMTEVCCLDLADPDDALYALMFALSVEALENLGGDLSEPSGL